VVGLSTGHFELYHTHITNHHYYWYYMYITRGFEVKAFMGQMPFLLPIRQSQTTEGYAHKYSVRKNYKALTQNTNSESMY